MSAGVVLPVPQYGTGLPHDRAPPAGTPPAPEAPAEFGARRKVEPGHPTVSVLITAYDRSDFVLRALETACAQTADAAEYEVVLVSNVPAHEGIAERVRARFPDHLLRFVPVGPSSVGGEIAVGIEACRGDIVSFLNDDDEWTALKVATVLRAFATNPHLGFLRNGLSFVDARGDPIDDHRHLMAWMEEAPEGGVLLHGSDPIGLGRSMRRLAVDFNDSAISVRRSSLGRGLDYLRRLPTHADTFLFFSAAICGDDLLFLPDPLTRYRVHGNSLTQANGNNGGNGHATMGRLSENDRKVVAALDVIREYALAEGRQDLLGLIDHDEEYWRLITLSRDDASPRGAVARQLLKFLPVWAASRTTSSALAVGWSVSRLASARLARGLYLQVRAGRAETSP